MNPTPAPTTSRAAGSQSARRPQPARPAVPGLDSSAASAQARRWAAAILEVLAGVRSPAQAAQALAVSLPRYYALELRALQGLLQACEPRPQGRVRSPASELARLRRDCDQLRRQ